MSNLIPDFQELLPKPNGDKYVLRLYVTGPTPRSARAIESIKRLCEANLRGRYELTVVDLYEAPGRAREQQIICAPTLVKEMPAPLRRLVGDLSDPNRVLLALEIKPDDG